MTNPADVRAEIYQSIGLYVRISFTDETKLRDSLPRYRDAASYVGRVAVAVSRRCLSFCSRRGKTTRYSSFSSLSLSPVCVTTARKIWTIDLDAIIVIGNQRQAKYYSILASVMSIPCISRSIIYTLQMYLRVCAHARARARLCMCTCISLHAHVCFVHLVFTSFF